MLTSINLYRPIAGRAVAHVCKLRYGPFSVVPDTVFRRWSSSGGNDGVDSAADENKSVDINRTEDTDPVFSPWRHERDLPPRFLEKDDLSGMPNNFRARLLRRLVACRELNISAFEALPLPFGLAHTWEDNLAHNFAKAFGVALEELLTSIFPGATVYVMNAEGDPSSISIDSSVRDEAGEEGSADANNLVENNDFLDNMIDKNLIAKYASIDPEKMHLKLSIRPMKIALQHIFAVPLLSRAIVEEKPHLKGAYREIERLFSENKSYAEVKEKTSDLMTEIGRERSYTRTVVVDMTIECLEYFQLKDASTGQVVQGMQDDDEEEEVVHHIRFEVVTQKSEDGQGRELAGGWKVIDIDDLLEGNVFH